MIKTGKTQRTALRDAVVDALGFINTDRSGVYYTERASITLTYDEETQCESFPTFCVILTDEELANDGMDSSLSTATVIVVVWARSEDDPRKALDEAVEDAARAIHGNPALRALTSHLSLESIATDEGTKIARPFAQAVMSWKLMFTRRMPFNG